MNPLQNTYNYFKYGKLVHKGADGSVIRRKINYPRFFDGRTGHVSTTKTFLDKNGNIEHQLDRSAYIDKDFVSSTVKPVLYDKSTGEKLAETKQPRTKTYLLKENEKILTDNTKPGYDYVCSPLPNGKTEYIIAYPETTIINKLDSTVVTTNHSKRFVV